MNSFIEFKATLEILVGKCQELAEKGHLAFKGKPEDETKKWLITPFLEALNYSEDDYTLEYKIGATHGPVLGWVDYGLHSASTATMAFVEAKELFDKNLWQRHQTQIRKYIRDYLLTLEGANSPIQWVFVTNFAELYVLNTIDMQPYLTLTYDQYIEKAELLWTLLERQNLSNDLIFANYLESRQDTLGKEFLQDLKRWRLILANGFRIATPGLTVQEAKAISQQLIDRVILVRVLETNGLQVYYSLVREYEHWRRFTRNKLKLPFYQTLQRVFIDLESDLNTELFKDELTTTIELALKVRNGNAVFLTIPNDFLEAVIVPNEPWSDRVRSTLKGMQLQFTYSTPYNYDFRTLTDDVIGSVYEQFLAHTLTEDNDRVAIESTANLRQREGAYYTPTPVVRYLVSETLDRDITPITEEAIELIHQSRFSAAKIAIEKLSGIRVIDIACGSGAFLIEAFDKFLVAYRYYNSELQTALTNSHEGFAPLLEGGGPIFDEGERIIHDNIFGIDKDTQAVEVAKVNLWLKLLKSNPQRYMRSDNKEPARLPELIRNIYVKDSIIPRDNLEWLTKGASQVIVIGNPPWGAEIAGTDTELRQYKLASGQYDSYELFIERALDLLNDGGRLGFVVPDSILHLPEHEPLRRMLLEKTSLKHLIKLGEGVFEDVFRAAVSLVFQMKSRGEDHTLSAAVVVKADRRQLLHKDVSGKYAQTIQDVENAHGHMIRQNRFSKNEYAVFDIYSKESDEPILAKIRARPLDWQLTWTGRGVEITGKGFIVRCPACSTWNNIPRRKKNGGFAKKVCSNPECQHEFEYTEKTEKATIVSESGGTASARPFIIGENLNRYRILKRLYIDTSFSKILPKCPSCSKFVATWSDVSVGERWFCPRCNSSFTKSQVTQMITLGINYKDPYFYKPPKLLVRKTGRGIYATIDDRPSYTNQVIFIFRLKDDLTGNDSNYSLWYFLGVINSKTMLYEYYKRTADIEWKSFPYLTQKTIQKFPVPRIDFSDIHQKMLHDEISRLAKCATDCNEITPAQDEALESLVGDIYSLTPTERAYINHELEEIARYGTLLGSHDDVDTEED